MNIRALEKKIKGRLAGHYAPLYMYGTEMMGDYYPRIGVAHKKVLTIAGSGDQMLNAYFFGASKVVGFYLNKLAKFMVHLKFEAVQSLSYKDFLRFFGTGKKDASLDYQLYMRLSLPKRTQKFFDQLYAYFNYNGRKMAQSHFFHERKLTYSPLTKINPYVENEHSYNSMKQILFEEKVNVIIANVTDIGKKIKEKYDVINLSNTSSFVAHHYRVTGIKNPEMHFYETVLLKLKKNLTRKGKIFYYAYSEKIYPNPMASKRPLISTPEVYNRFKGKGYTMTVFRFKGLFAGFDKVIVFQKK